MKIAMVGQFPPHFGGVGSYIHTLSKELIKRGHEVFVITYSHKDIKDINSIHVIGARMINISGFKELSFMISSKKVLEKLVLKENIDIIHGNSLMGAGSAAVKIGKKYNIPTYVTAHGVDITLLYDNLLVKYMINQVLDKADNVLAVSNSLMNKIINTNVKNIQNKTFIHQNAVDVNKFKEISNKLQKNKPSVIFIGHLEKRKNVELILNAKKLSSMDYELIFVGDGKEANKLKYRVKKENIEDVKFLGYRKNVENILSKADVLVLPSIEEGFGIVLIEALACGLPVIGSNVDGIKEVITPDVGLLINPYSTISLCNAIDKILSDKKLYNKFKSNARKRAMQFSQMKIPYEELK